MIYGRQGSGRVLHDMKDSLILILILDEFLWPAFQKKGELILRSSHPKINLN